MIDRLLLKDPKHRFQTAAETREALEAAIDHRMHAATVRRGTPRRASARSRPTAISSVVAPVDKTVDKTVVPTPADGKQAETKATETKPAVTKTKPVVTKTQTKPAVTKARTKPTTTTKPTATKPVTTTTTTAANPACRQG